LFNGYSFQPAAREEAGGSFIRDLEDEDNVLLNRWRFEHGEKEIVNTSAGNSRKILRAKSPAFKGGKRW
jgi:hypothetical protein